MPAPAAPLWSDEAPIRIGISSCLLGEAVRWDGGHKRDRFLHDVLAPFVEYVPVCPEVEAGLGVPREPIRLVREAAEGPVRVVGVDSGTDHTRTLDAWSARRLRALAAEDLCGFVLKKDSPSCGMERVKVYAPPAPARREGRGRFAEALLAACPELPVEEEGRLQDPVLRENWIERIFAYRRLRSFLSDRLRVGELVRFHTAHKLQLMAHAPKAYAELGRLVAEARGRPAAELRRAYEQGFMAALAKRASRGRHANVLQHAAGYFKKLLGAPARQELAGLIDDYRRGLVPLVVPLTLLRHHVAQHGISYLAGQVYLEPHPKELMLRNHV